MKIFIILHDLRQCVRTFNNSLPNIQGEYLKKITNLTLLKLYGSLFSISLCFSLSLQHMAYNQKHAFNSGSSHSNECAIQRNEG